MPTAMCPVNEDVKSVGTNVLKVISSGVMKYVAETVDDHIFAEGGTRAPNKWGPCDFSHRRGIYLDPP